MSKRWDAVQAACAPVIESMGFELVDMQYAKEADTGWVLTFFIHKSGGVNINDCEAVSRAIEPIVDELDPSDDAYFLSVSSLGLDRAFKKNRDFERYIGEEIEIRFYAPIVLEQEDNPAHMSKTKKAKAAKGVKEIHGRLQSVSDQEVEIELDGKLHRFSRELMAVARPYIKW